MIAGVPYDFRIYSLLLFGTVILAGGVTAIRASSGIAQDDPAARRRSAKAMTMVLATVIPVIPLQDAAPILIVPAAVALAALTLGWLRLPTSLYRPVGELASE